MSASTLRAAQSIGVLEPSCRDTAARALTIVRDGVITGEGPTTKGRVHFSRELDADDAAWCARILTATAVEHQPVSRAEAEALFEINDAATERSDGGRFFHVRLTNIVCVSSIATQARLLTRSKAPCGVCVQNGNRKLAKRQ